MSEEKLNKDGLTRVWLKVWSLVKTLVGDVDVEGKGDLQTQVNSLDRRVADCFTSASNGKKLVADAVTGKGVATLATDTFATIAANIAKIKTAARLQGKSAALHTGQTSVTLKPDSGYDGLSQAAVSITLQEKTQNITSGNAVVTPDSGKVLSKVTVNGPTNRGAWTGATTGNGNVAIPAGYHNGSGYVSGAGAYNKGVSDADARANTNSTNYKTGYNAGVADADARANTNSTNYKTGYNAGVSATKKGTAGTGDVLSGKTFTNASTVGATGAMSNKGGTTVTAGSVTQDDTYTYLAIPSSGYYNTASKVRALNSDLDKMGIINTLKLIASANGSGGSTVAGAAYMAIKIDTSCTVTITNLTTITSTGGSNQSTTIQYSKSSLTSGMTTISSGDSISCSAGDTIYIRFQVSVKTASTDTTYRRSIDIVIS